MMWRRIQMTIQWEQVREYKEIIYEKYNGIAKVTMNRPEKHNAFTPLTVNEMIDAFADARDDASIGVIILTGAGGKAFCSGGDQDRKSTRLNSSHVAISYAVFCMKKEVSTGY